MIPWNDLCSVEGTGRLQKREANMRKLPIDTDNLTEEELCTEMVELTCDEMDSLSRAFQMLTQLCSELQDEVDQEAPQNIPQHRIH